MNTHRFILEPYKGIGTRHICPSCHRKRCFSRYIDAEKKVTFPDYVGRCDREQKCGYHFTPSEFFKQNPMEKEAFNNEKCFQQQLIMETNVLAPPSYIDMDIVNRSLKAYPKNKLFQFLSRQFGETETMKLMEKYRIGSSKHWDGATVFWQIDREGRVRTGKIMLYNPEMGKRVKQPFNHVTWVHSILRKDGFHLRQCFFGEHLLTSDKNTPVALVESEKTALIASYYLPQYLWIASGGKNGCFNEHCLSVLAGRYVVLFPDLGATEYWKNKINLMKECGIDARLFDYLEAHAPEEERNEGYDIADYLLKIQPDEAILQAMVRKNPCLGLLIEKLNLELVKR